MSLGLYFKLFLKIIAVKGRVCKDRSHEKADSDDFTKLLSSLDTEKKTKKANSSKIFSYIKKRKKKVKLKSVYKGKISRFSSNEFVYTKVNGFFRCIQFNKPSKFSARHKKIQFIMESDAELVSSRYPLFFYDKVEEKGKKEKEYLDTVFLPFADIEQLPVFGTLVNNGRREAGAFGKINNSDYKSVVKVFYGLNFVDLISHIKETDYNFVLCEHNSFVKIYRRGFVKNSNGTISFIAQLERMETNIAGFPVSGRNEQLVLESLFKRTLAGLVFMVEKGILHLDIKSKNIVFKDMVFKYCDFGTSLPCKKFDPKYAKSGGLEYQAPELVKLIKLKDEEDYHKADLWALGLSWVEFCLGLDVKETAFSFAYKDKKRINIVSKVMFNAADTRAILLSAVKNRLGEGNSKYYHIIEKALRLECENKTLPIFQKSLKAITDLEEQGKANRLTVQQYYEQNDKIEKMLVIDIDHALSEKQKTELVESHLKKIFEDLKEVYQGKGKGGELEQLKAEVLNKDIIVNIINLRPRPSVLYDRLLETKITMRRSEIFPVFCNKPIFIKELDYLKK